MRLGDRLVAAVLIIISVTGYIHSSSFPTEAGVFPRFVFSLLFGLALLQFAITGRGKPETGNPMHGVVYSRLVPAILLTVLYVLLIAPVGYVVMTPVFLVLFMLVMEQRNPLTVALVSLGTTGLLYVVFRVLLYVPIPLGPLFE